MRVEPHDGVSSSYRRDRREFPTLHQERTQRDEPGRGPSPGTESAGTLILGSRPENYSLLPPPTSLQELENELRESPLHMEKKELLFELGFLQGVLHSSGRRDGNPHSTPRRKTKNAENTDKAKRSLDRV